MQVTVAGRIALIACDMLVMVMIQKTFSVTYAKVLEVKETVRIVLPNELNESV